MPNRKSEIVYACRRSGEEMVRAINATSEAAASIHMRLSSLYAARAVKMVSRLQRVRIVRADMADLSSFG